MSTCGSFSPDSYSAFANGMQNPSNFMVMGPATHSKPNHNPKSFYMGEDEEGEEMEDWEDEDEAEPNGRMAMGQLRSMAADVMAILSELTPDDYLEPWVAAKITMSKQNLSAVADYLQFNDDYSEEVYDYKRCVTPDGRGYGVPNSKKCAPPNREAKKECTTDSECQEMYGGSGDPEPMQSRKEGMGDITVKTPGGNVRVKV